MIWGAVMGAVEWNKKEDLVLVSNISNVKGCGSGSAWIHKHFPFWIRIRIQYAPAPLFLTFEQLDVFFISNKENTL